MLRGLIQIDANDRESELTPEGLSGLSELLNIMHQCIRNISSQLHEDSDRRTLTVLYDYLHAHPEAETPLRQFLSQAKNQGFTE